MKVETFFERFELFADATGAVAKMRELVLELAVKGALSDRRPADQNDPTWREFIATSGQGSGDVHVDWQQPFEIPSAWRWTCLDNLGTTRVRNDVEDGTRVSFVPMALISSTYGMSARSEERTWSEIKKGFTHFAEGDVVMAKITPCFENAKSAVMRNLVNGVGAGTTELHVFRRRTKAILPEFVLIYVKTRGFITRGEPRMTGSAGQKRVPREYFATSPFPLPPLAEQRRIVAKVNELMALCDRLEVQQQERETRQTALARASLARFADAPTSTNLNYLFHPSYAIPPADLRKSILTLAVQGKLVPQDPSDETTDHLLAKVLAERQSLGRAVGGDPDSPNVVDYEIPETWRWRRLEDVLVFGPTNGLSPKAVEYETPVRSLTLSATTSGQFNGEYSKFVPVDLPPESELWLQDGDILIQRGNTIDYVGVSAIYRGEPNRFIYPDLMMKLRVSSFIDTDFVHIAMSEEKARAFLRARASGTSGTMPKINQATVRRLPIPIPPRAEQRRIVTRVKQLLALVDDLGRQITSSLSAGRHVLDAVVAEVTAAG